MSKFIIRHSIIMLIEIYDPQPNL